MERMILSRWAPFFLAGILFFIGIVFGVKLSREFKSANILRKISAAISFSLLIFIAAGLAWTAKILMAYNGFTYKELIAIIRCVKSEDKSYNFTLYWTPVGDNRAGKTEAFFIRGEQWSLGGDILKWHPALQLIGLRTGHKPSRICGRFVRAKDDRLPLASEYDLNHGTDGLWIFLHKYNRFFPFVETVYGSCVYTFPDYERSFKVYITATGYMLKRE